MSTSPKWTCAGWLFAAIGCVMLGACGDSAWNGRVFLYNGTDEELLAEVVTLGGDCNALWRSGEGFVRQEDFASGLATKYRIEPGRVAPLGAGCIAAVSVGRLRTEVIWDPALPMREVSADEPQDDHSQFLELLARGDRLRFEFRTGLRKLDVVPAGGPLPASECAAAEVPPVGISLFNGEAAGTVQDIEQRDGCFTLRLLRASALDADDAGNDESPSLAAVHACVPAAFFPFVKGDTLRVVDGLITRTSGDFAQLALLAAKDAPLLPSASAAPKLRAGWSLSECGFVRDSDGFAWQPLEMRLAGIPLPAGVPVEIGKVTYYVARAAHPLLAGVSNEIIWLELAR